MRYLWLITVLIALEFGCVTTTQAQTTDTPTPTDTPTATSTETPTFTPTPDFVTVYDLGGGKSGEVIYSATAGELALIAIGMVLVILFMYLIFLESKR
jgi:hypothetical protein